MTVTLSGLDVPKTSPDPVHQLHSAYSTDIPGLSKIQSAEAKDREEKLSTITFKVPETIEVGTYHLTKGHVFKKWGGFPVQGVMWTGTKEAMFYEDDMPDLELVVKTEDMAAAEEVEALIDDLGEITRLEQEAEVKEAREAYDALTEAQKKLVKNLDKLEKAEAAIEALKHVPEEGGYVTVDIERFTLGQGFYKEPVKVKFEAGETAKDILVRLAGDKLLFNREGTYLAGIRGADTGVIWVPDYISEKLGGPTTEKAKEVGNADDLLAEFDYSKGSGWYYFVNNKAPNVGMAAYYLKPGDVVRLQFTLLWGMDLTGVQIGEEDAPAVTISNKDEAIRLLGEINGGSRKEQLLANKDGKAAYDEVVKLVQNAVSDQKELDAAVKKLKDVFGKLPENPDTKPDPKPPVDPDEETKAASITNKKYGVTLRGEGLTEDMELVITQLKAGNADVEQMRKKIPSTKALYRAFDIELVKNGKEIEVPDESILYIPVGEKYDGQTLQVLHCHDSRVDTTLKGKVSNGTLAVEVDSFSSFGVVVKLKDLQNSDEAAATGKEAAKVTSKVQTGDTAPITLLVIVLIVAAAGIGWVLYKKRKDRGEQ